MSSNRMGDQDPWLSARPGGVGVLTAWRSGGGRLHLASSGTDGVIRIWDPEGRSSTGTTLVGHEAVVWALTHWIDREGNDRLASAGEDLSIRIWDTDRGECIALPLIGHSGWIPDITSWTADYGSRIASASNDGTVRIWDADRGTALGGPLIKLDRPLWAVTSWPAQDGAVRIAAGGDDGIVRVWDSENRSLISEIPLTSSGIWALAEWTVPGAGPRLAAGTTDGMIHIWDAVTDAALSPPLRGHSANVGALAVCAQSDGVRLASAGADGTIRLWDPESGVSMGPPIETRAGFQPNIACWLGPSDSVRLASAGDDGGIRVWDATTREQVGRPLVGHTAAVWCLANWITDDGAERIATGGDETVVRIWDAATGRPCGDPLVGHTAAVWALVTWKDDAGRRLIASSGDDAVIRVWDADTGTPVGRALVGHAGWVSSLAYWRGRDGSGHLASGGVDGTIVIWKPEADEAPGIRMTHRPRVLALEAWTVRDGSTWLASAGEDHEIRLWNADTGEQLGAPLAGHTAGVRALTHWVAPDGSNRLASSGYDGEIRIWDTDSGAQVVGPLSGHNSIVGALISWTGRDGRVRLASGGDDRTVRLWDAETGAALPPALTGHTAGIWALTCWNSTDGEIRIASSGYDGTVRLWNAENGRPLRTIEVGPVTMWALSDAPSTSDELGRRVLADAVVDQLLRTEESFGAADSGPTVVSVEGPWGCGKTTLMMMIRERLPAASADSVHRRRLRVADAIRLIRHGQPITAAGPPRSTTGRVVTVWFNPWAHESGEQIWAGMTQEIIAAAAPVLYPSEADREWYWFGRNLDRVDGYKLHQVLLRRVVSPWLGAALLAVAAPLILEIGQVKGDIVVVHDIISYTRVALFLGATFLVAGVAHTFARFLWSPVAHYVPNDLLKRPVSTAPPSTTDQETAAMVSDPLQRASAGSLYLYQHDVDELLTDLEDAGCTVVIFIDDIDRCRPSTSSEVFEAVNLFLTGFASKEGRHVRFVIGLDPVVVASRLDLAVHSDAGEPADTGVESTGWAFLRKIIQLPILIPQTSDAGIQGFIESLTPGARGAANSRNAPPPHVPHQRLPPDGPFTGQTATAPRAAAAEHPAVETRPQADVATVARWALEEHPEVRRFVAERLKAQPDRSIREAKRMLNIWQLYERVLATIDPVVLPDASIERAKQLFLLAEIITRWPALQRELHRRRSDESGLQILAEAASDGNAWRQAVARLWPERAAGHGPALSELRELLRGHDGRHIADLATKVL
jgi:WD40 repeat protein